MNYLFSVTHTNECSTNDDKRKRNTRGDTMMDMLTKACNGCVKLSIRFDHKTWICYGKNSSLFRSYAVFLGSSKVSMFIDY